MKKLKESIKKNLLTTVVSTTIVAVMLLATAVPNMIPNQNDVVTTAQAKTKKTKKKKAKNSENPKLSKTKLNLRKKKSSTLKVNGTKRKVKWAVSDKSLAKIKKKGKNKAKVTAKKKAGAFVVRATAGNVVMYCLVSVNGSLEMSAKSKAWAREGGFEKVLKQASKATPNGSKSTNSNSNSNSNSNKSGNESKSGTNSNSNGNKTPQNNPATNGNGSQQETNGTQPQGQTQTNPSTNEPKKVEYVLIDHSNLSIMEGKSFQLTANAYPIEAVDRSVSWSSSNTSVASVDSTGKVVGIKPGTTTITATAKDGSGKSDSITATVTADPLKPVKEGLANAKKQGPEAFIRYCETGPYARKIKIGIYGARYLVGTTGWDSDAIDAEADFGAALDALYKPWIKSIYEKSYASKTDVPLYKMVYMMGYVSVMHKRHMTYCNRTYGWCLCPTIAPLLRDGITTNIGTGYSTSQSYMGGNCAADADLLMHFADYIGLSNTWCEGANGAYSHWATYVKIGSDTYMFDATNNRARKLVNGQLVAMTQDVWDEDERLENIYGVQPYTP